MNYASCITMQINVNVTMSVLKIHISYTQHFLQEKKLKNSNSVHEYCTFHSYKNL